MGSPTSSASGLVGVSEAATRNLLRVPVCCAGAQLDVLSANLTSSAGMEIAGQLLVNGRYVRATATGRGRVVRFFTFKGVQNLPDACVRCALCARWCRPRKKRLFQRTSCYVQQRDILMSSSSVREAITFSALLKLPASMPKCAWVQVVWRAWWRARSDLRVAAAVCSRREVKMARVEAVLRWVAVGVVGGWERRSTVGPAPGTPNRVLAHARTHARTFGSELELEGCADTLIGDEAEGIKGISGGQKRRVSLGIELVKDPAVIFL